MLRRLKKIGYGIAGTAQGKDNGTHLRGLLNPVGLLRRKSLSSVPWQHLPETFKWRRGPVRDARLPLHSDISAALAPVRVRGRQSREHRPRTIDLAKVKSCLGAFIF